MNNRTGGLSHQNTSMLLAWTDGGYADKLVTWAKTALKRTLETVRRPDDLHAQPGRRPH